MGPYSTRINSIMIYSIRDLISPFSGGIYSIRVLVYKDLFYRGSHKPLLYRDVFDMGPLLYKHQFHGDIFDKGSHKPIFYRIYRGFILWGSILQGSILRGAYSISINFKGIFSIGAVFYRDLF